jgi:hypothetical protein
MWLTFSIFIVGSGYHEKLSVNELGCKVQCPFRPKNSVRSHPNTPFGTPIRLAQPRSELPMQSLCKRCASTLPGRCSRSTTPPSLPILYGDANKKPGVQSAGPCVNPPGSIAFYQRVHPEVVIVQGLMSRPQTLHHVRGNSNHTRSPITFKESAMLFQVFGQLIGH